MVPVVRAGRRPVISPPSLAVPTTSISPSFTAVQYIRWFHDFHHQHQYQYHYHCHYHRLYDYRSALALTPSLTLTLTLRMHTPLPHRQTHITSVGAPVEGAILRTQTYTLPVHSALPSHSFTVYRYVPPSQSHSRSRSCVYIPQTLSPTPQADSGNLQPTHRPK
jgi:hypothetical protein